ncbi:MAG: CubicO group peptidase (beta-lactamase class C family) [Kiritimatiellia bacterium]|jgi:CubicO group peptidase (beta-lactamase class C family)
MKPVTYCLALLCIFTCGISRAQESNGLAPEVTDLNAADVSYALEKKIPDLKRPFINPAPGDRKDGIAVGKLGVDGGDREAILAFANEISAGGHGEIDSLLIARKGKLIFESYYRRGRINYPHYQMSITKSYTALAIGRAIQLGHLSMADLDKPVIGILDDLYPARMVPGARSITVAQAMNMRSGIRMDEATSKKLMRTPDLLKGPGQIQAYMENSAPITEASKAFKYQGSDPSITMQVLHAFVPTSAKAFIADELLAPMGIKNFGWQEDVSGLPKSAAGSSMRSRDMLKFGLLIMNDGMWEGEQLIPKAFIEKATDKIHTNPQGTSYGYFFWRADMNVGDRTFDCRSGRGAGGQFIFMIPELELLVVITAHNQGMGRMLQTTPLKILPAFVE